MPILLIAVIALQIVLAIHVFRAGSSKIWLPVIVLFPVIGSLIYILVEMLPQLFRGNDVVSIDDARGAQQRDVTRDRADSGVQWSRRRQGNPNPGNADPTPRPSNVPGSGAAWRAEQMFRTPKDPLREGMIHEKLKRAEACLTMHRYDEAIDLFASARQGFFADSPDILFGLARAHFGRGDYDAALNLLDELVTGRPAFQPHGVAIQKARVLAKQGDVVAALALLDAVLGETGNLEGRRLEAQYRRAEILWQSGEIQQAAAGLTEILRHEQFFRINDEERHWIRLADQALRKIA